MRKLFFFFFLVFICGQIKAQSWISSNSIFGNSAVKVTKSIIDNNNNFFVSGIFTGNLYTPDDTLYSSGIDIFVAKFNANLEYQWIERIGGNNTDKFSSISTDGSNIYVAGSYNEDCIFKSYDTLISVGDYDNFIAKYDNDGNIQWVKRIGINEAYQQIEDISVDPSKDIVVTIRYGDSITINDTTYYGRTNVKNGLICKLNSDSEFVWIKNILCSGNTYITSVSTYENAYYFNGIFNDTLFLDTKTIIDTTNTENLFLYKTDIHGTEKWVRRTYGNGDDVTGTNTQDQYGNVYYTGYFNSDPFYVDSTSNYISHHLLQNEGNSDLFILKYNKNGNLLWSKRYGQDGKEWAISIVERNSILYITGRFSNQINFGSDTLVSSGVNDYDFFIGTFDTDGNKLKAVGLEEKGNENIDVGTAISVTENNIAFVSGFFQSDTIIIGDSIYIKNGLIDVFMGKYIPEFNATFTEVKNVSCYGGNDGRLKVTPYFGVPPFNYSWSHDASLDTSVADTLSPGNYSVTITDNRDSTAIASMEITQPDSITITDSIVDVTCYDEGNGKIYIDVEGGTVSSGYTYKWLSEASGVRTQNKNQTGLSNGKFYFSVTDDNSCMTSDSFTVSQPDPIIFYNTTVTDVNPAGAGNGTVDLNVSGGTGSPGSAFFSYAWQGPDGYNASTQDISSLDGGQYTVTVTDSLGCEEDTALLVNEGNTLIAYISYKKDVDCKDDNTGMAVVSVTGETGTLEYSWENGAGTSVGGNNDTITSLVADAYYVTVIDDNDTAHTSVNISEPQVALSSTINGLDVKCAGASDGIIELTVNGGTLPYSYDWNNGAKTEDLNGVPPDIYTVDVIDANGCTTSESLQILGPVPISLDITIEQGISCYGNTDGRVKATAEGGTPYGADSKYYIWDDPAHQNSRTADNLEPGTYTVTVTDLNECKTTGSVSLVEPDLLVVTANHTNGCNNVDDGAVQLTVSGGTLDYTYDWSNFDTTKNILELAPGDYTVTVTDANGCKDTSMAMIINPPAINISSASATDVTGCYGDSTATIDVDVSGGTGELTYSLIPSAAPSNDSGSFINIPRGKYIVRILDENTCADTTDTLTVSEPGLLVVDSVAVIDASTQTSGNGSITVYCTGGTEPLTYTLGPAAIATNQTGIFSSLDTGTYNVSITDDNACGPAIREDIKVGSLTKIKSVTSNEITVYPNPSDGKITIELAEKLSEDLSVMILNNSGQSILVNTFKKGTVKKVFDLSDYPAGVYYLQMNGAGLMVNKKITIE